MLLFNGLDLRIEALRPDLNTSHVIVQQNEEIENAKMIIFKYISCYCSTFSGMDRLPFGYHLNTSHVIVQPVRLLTTCLPLLNLNTSHVIVQL